MKFILATKKNMTQMFDGEGKAHAATLLSVSPLVITQIKTLTTDGYSAVQVGSGVRKAKNINKAQKGHFKTLGNFAHVKEFRVENTETFKVGDSIDASIFALGDKVTISGISKGKGFQGVVKRHGFGGGPRSHGQKHSEREPGSIGSGLRNKVPRGMRMAGRMGNDRVSIPDVAILHIDKDAGEILVKGALPGRRGTLLEIVA
jgi:large subunit ribosomal protein L3